jgi:O-6-methylguanine DNA methyltransferase
MTVRIAATARGISRVTSGAGIVAMSATARRHAERAQRELAEYLGGRRSYFSVPLDLSGISEFQRRVLTAIARIPFGGVVSYTELARAVGAPSAARAVGTALARNPMPILIPCHRAIRRDGTWGPFALGGAMKTALLALERAPGFVGCTTTRVVCRLGCPDARRIREEHRVPFGSPADARRAGYRPCRRCFSGAHGAPSSPVEGSGRPHERQQPAIGIVAK